MSFACDTAHRELELATNRVVCEADIGGLNDSAVDMNAAAG